MKLKSSRMGTGIYFLHRGCRSVDFIVLHATSDLKYVNNHEEYKGHLSYKHRTKIFSSLFPNDQISNSKHWNILFFFYLFIQ